MTLEENDWNLNRQGEKGHWTVDYTGTQSFITLLSLSLGIFRNLISEF